MNKYLFFTQAIILQSLKFFLSFIVFTLFVSLIFGSFVNPSRLTELTYLVLLNMLPLLLIFTVIMALNSISSIYFMKPEFIYQKQENSLKSSNIWDFPNGILVPDDNNPPIQFPISIITFHFPKNLREKKRTLIMYLPFALVKQFSSSSILSFFNASRLLLPKALAETDIVRIPRAGLSLQKNQPIGDLFIRIRPVSSLRYYILVLFIVILVFGITFFYVNNPPFL